MSASEPGPGRPIIGITTYRQRAQSGVWDVEAAFLPTVYVDRVTDAGGAAVLLTPQPLSPGLAESIVGHLDGLVVAGGVDVDPARYGQSRHAETDEPQPLRDDWDMALLDAAIAAETPFLAICRGAQVLNVLLGGSLYQHLPEVIGTTGYQQGGGEFGSVPISITAGSALHGIVGDATEGLVYHHQAIDWLGDGLVATAHSADGVVEAIELPSVPYGVGVQWHPEQNPDDLRLFDSLVAAAREHSGGTRSDGGRPLDTHEKTS